MRDLQLGLIDVELPVVVDGAWSPRQADAVLEACAAGAERYGFRLDLIDITVNGGPERRTFVASCACCGAAISIVVPSCHCGRWRYGRNWERIVRRVRMDIRHRREEARHA